jgi:hypothetical protein
MQRTQLENDPLRSNLQDLITLLQLEYSDLDVNDPEMVTPLLNKEFGLTLTELDVAAFLGRERTIRLLEEEEAHLIYKQYVK